MTRATYRTEHPSFGDLDVTLPEGMVDQSWSQDMCPSWGIPTPDTERTGVAGLTLFVDYADPAQREMGETAERFGATTGDPTDSATSWFTTNDWPEMLAWIEAHRPDRKASS